MHLFDTITHWTWQQNCLTLYSAAGFLTLTPLADDLIHLHLEAPGGLLVLPSGAIVKADWAIPDATVTEGDGAITLQTSRMRVVAQLSPFRLSWYEGERLFATDESFHVSQERILATRYLPAEEHYYGFGEKTGFLDKRGRQLEMWATDQGVMTHTDPLYQSIPFFIGLTAGKAHGLFVDCTARSRFDMGFLDPSESTTIEVHSPVYDAYVFAGPLIADIIGRYSELTGRTPLPPLWSLAYHQCRYSYYPESKVRDVAALFRAKQIPCDAIWLDIDYMDAYRVFTWDRERFPHPSQLTADLAVDGFKLVTIVDPGVKVDPGFLVYQEGVAAGYFCQNPDGTPFVGKVWPGPSVFPDFLQAGTRHWWGDWLNNGYLQQGVAGIWNDMNEPANQARNELNEKTLPHQTRQGEEGRKVAHKDVHNAYGFRMGQATFEGLRRCRPEQRPFVLTRSGYAGIQRYAAVWTGDNYSWWEGLLDSIPLCLGLGLSGVPFVGADVGGFGDNPSGELFARWLQVGAFTPFFRTHSCKGSRDQEPWSFGPEVEAISRRYIQLRYRLLPYFYTLFEEASRTGMPVMRPLLLEYQDDPETYHISDQFLVGPGLMVAPVYQPGVTKRMVYLPAGDWYDFWTGQRYAGKQYVVAAAPLDTLPLFARAGTVLPMGPIMDHVGARPLDTLTLHLFPGEGEFVLYEDAGDGYGPAARTRIRLSEGRVEVGAPEGEYRPQWQQVGLVIHGVSGSLQVEGGTVASEMTTEGARVAVVHQAGGFTAQWA